MTASLLKKRINYLKEKRYEEVVWQSKMIKIEMAPKENRQKR